MARDPAHPVVHLELHTGDRSSAQAFYAGLCGWRSEEVEVDGASAYLALELSAAVGGDIVECAAARPLWLPYVEVAEIVAATERAAEMGARILLEPREGPAGWRSVVSAPAGGELAFWQSKERRSR